jgi:glycine/D-amino acid oxidase-like deaminating enzyme
MANTFDVLVVGGGTIGVSAAYHAAQRGLTVGLVDQFPIPQNNGSNNEGSSRKLERMFRILYAQTERVRLVETAYAMWHEMQDQVSSDPNDRILVEQDQLFFGNSEATTFEGNINDIQKSMDTLGIPYDRLGDPDEIAKRYPIFNRDALQTPNGTPYVGLVQNNGATINVQRAFQVIRELAERTGKLTNVTATADSIHVQLPTGEWEVRMASGDRYCAKYLIICPGMWLNEVLSSFNLKAYNDGKTKWQIWQMTLAYFQPGPNGSQHWPIWYEFGNTDTDSDRLFYGFPDVGFTPDTTGKLKISADYTYTFFESPSAVTNEPDPKLVEDITKHLEQLLMPGVLNLEQSFYLQACPYSISPDGDMVIGRIPVAPETEQYWPNASIFCMASGRGFKYTPVFGRILVDLAVDGETAYDKDLTNFSTTRPQVFQEA